jgi:hypothetical protein
MTPSQIRAILEFIDEGVLSVTEVPLKEYVIDYEEYYDPTAENPNYDGKAELNPRFRVNGLHVDLQFVVFDDCDEWDYLDSIILNGIVIKDFDSLRTDEWEKVGHFSPNKQSLWGRFGAR